MASAETIKEKPGGKSLLSTSAGGASLLIALQAGSRALTFIVNQILLRYLSPELLAVSTQLEVYSITVLFFSRESLRVAIQRQTDSSDDNLEAKQDGNLPIRDRYLDSRTTAGKSQAIVNLSYISIALGLGSTVLFGWIYANAGQTGVVETPYFRQSLKLYGVAAILELLAEPCFVVVQQKSAFKIRAATESIATVLRCIVTCAVAVWAARHQTELGVMPFAIGQVVYAISILLVYLLGVWNIALRGGFSLTIKPIDSKKEKFIYSYFSKPLLSLGGSMMIQSMVKHVLTQGDTFLIASMATQTAQGIYALASNYGGLIARLVLQPIEEMSRNYFGKLLSVIDGKPTKEATKKASTDLHRLLRIYLILSVAVVSVGPTVAPLLLNFIAGPRWQSSGAGNVLAVYCYYIPLLALNGVCEAFVAVVATEAEVYRQSLWMTAFSAGFGGAAYLFLGVLDLGAEGLVLANMANMLLRIIWCGNFILAYCGRHGAKLKVMDLLPRSSTMSLGVVTYAALAQMKTTFTGGLVDIIKSGLVAVIFVILL
ncbi:Oligosaccharide translocation protein rft1 [Ciborinia camelliae]|nr:Oligosaccharide translocation protein rft1 [Ciborinia camelliae]